MKFKQYILNEQKDYFSDKVNDILTGLHELIQSEKQMGAKHMLRSAEVIANQIRKILHTSWPRSEHKYLKVLQKCGVALMKAIDEKGDLPDVFNSIRVPLEDMSHKLGAPANKLGTISKDKPRQPPKLPPGTPQQQQPPQPQAAPSGPQPPQMSPEMQGQQ